MAIIDAQTGDDPPTLANPRRFAAIVVLVLIVVAGFAFVVPRFLGPAASVSPPPDVRCPDPVGLSISGRVSDRDDSGALIGETLDSTTIRAAAPRDLQAGVAYDLRWTFTGTAPLQMYAAHADGTTLRPTVTPLATPDAFSTPLTFPKGGCWQLRVWRGPLSGNVWVVVRPAAQR